MRQRYHYTVADFATKQAARASLLRLLEPLRPFYSEGGARLELGVTSAHYENDSVPMEAFARPLWGLVPFWAGGGSDPGFEDLYRRGLAAGTDPSGPEYWHTCRDYDQKFVEMAVIAYGMLLAPDRVWDPLSDREKDHLVQWLWEIDRHECCACNWQWFCILTNLALKVRGRPYSRERIESGLALLERWYDTGGWYNDGNGGEKDYYNPFVMTSYGLLYAMFMEDEEPDRCALFRARAKEFARDFVYWFADDGAALAYGRSMTYRFAQVAFFSIALLSGTETLPLPVVKGIVTRHLAWWLNKPICDNAGILTIGYAYPNLQMSESYNAPGSPYWALKAFAFLALKDDHPFWSAPCAPLPELERCHFLPHAGMIVQRGRDNVVALLPGRKQSDAHGHTMEKYGKFAYSSRFGFSVSRSDRSLEECAPDSTLAFLVNGRVYGKDLTGPGAVVREDEIAMDWSPLPGIRVHTVLRPIETGHVRVHTVESSLDCMVYDCGFALDIGDPVPWSKRETGKQAVVCSGEDRCAVTAGDSGTGRVLIPHPNTNLISPKTAIPMAEYQIHRGSQVLESRFDYL